MMRRLFSHSTHVRRRIMAATRNHKYMVWDRLNWRAFNCSNAKRRRVCGVGAGGELIILDFFGMRIVQHAAA